jgi:acetyl-CoA carboxylase biotin carboxyl carrier protein
MQGERGTKKEPQPGSASAVNLKSLKKVVTIMNRAQLTELNIEQEGIKIHLRKGPSQDTMPQMMAAPMMPQMMQAPSAAPAAAPAAAASSAPAVPTADANLYTIASPMVGTFYRAPGPDAAPFVSEGAVVGEGTVVCIVEAMKLMNEIKAEIKGVIEFGQPLFLVERKG